MDDRFNTIAGWALGAGIVLLGGVIVTGEMFKAERPETMGYPIAGVVEEGGSGAEAEQPIAHYLQTADASRGEAVFRKCTACHTINQGGANGLGPNLHGVMGEAVATGMRGYALFRAAARPWRHLGLGYDEPVAAQPAHLRARDPDDLRRPFRSAGPRRRHALSQPEWRPSDHSAAAGRRARGE